jgi:hypothetical protein
LPKTKKLKVAVVPKVVVPKVVVPKVVLTKRSGSKGKEVATKAVKKDTGSDEDCRGTTMRVDQGFGEMVESLAGDVSGLRKDFVEVKRIRAVLEKMEGHMGDLVGLLKGKWSAEKATGTQMETGTQTGVEESEDVVMTGTETETAAPSSSAAL